MNNTLSHPGLSYSHPSYAPHHPSHTHLMQQQGSSAAHLNSPESRSTSSHAPYSSSNSSLQQQIILPQSSTTHPSHSSQQQSMASHSVPHPANSPQSLSSPGLPLQSSRGPQSTNNPSIYPSVCINPYMSIALSPSSHHAAPYLAPYLHPHLHPHAFIAPPPGFNIHSSSNSQQTRQGMNLSSGAYGPSSNSSSSLTPETSSSKAASSTSGYAITDPVVKMPYAGVVTNAAGAMVPYAGTHASPQPQGYHTSSLPPYQTTYRYPPGYCPPPPTPHYPSGGVDSALLYKLHETHLSFLNTDDSPDKMEMRKDLDDLLQRLVSVTPHEHKWRFADVRKVLETSASKQLHFDPFKAASAFEALASYASNLIVHPWRREYRNIKLYSGYWVHNVDEHLMHPETILRLMGYLPQRSKTGDEASAANVGCYQLPGSIIDGDVVSGLALDCLIAWCECQVIGRLQQQFPQLSPQQILQYRQLSTGSYEQTVQSLLYFLKSHDSATSPAAVVDVGQDVTDCGGSCHRRHSQDGTTSSRQSESSKQQLLSLLRPLDGHQLSSSPSSPRQMDSGNNQLVRLVPKSYNLQQSASSKSSLDSESWSPKKTTLAISSVPHSGGGVTDQTLVCKTSASEQPPIPSRRSGSGGTNICSLPSTPTMTSTTSILDRIHHLPESIPSSLDQLAVNSSNKEKYSESRVIAPSTSSYGVDKYTPQLAISGKHHSGDKPSLRHSGGIGGGDNCSYDKQQRASDRLQLNLMQEQLDHFIGDTSPDLKPSRADRYREGGGGGGKRMDGPHGSSNASLVATAQLIDHEELRQGGSRDGGHATTHRHRESTSHLPKVLPQIRSSTFSSRSNLPVDPPNVCSLPSSIPRELFQDNTFEEHIKESYSLLNDAHRLDTSSRKTLLGCGGGGSGQTYSDTWGFVMQDLEKKGYNKDVGNRGDILHHLSNSKSNTTSNIAGTTFTNSVPNAASGPTVVVPGAGQFGLDGEVTPELIPSTVHSVKKDRTDTASSANTLNNNNNINSDTHHHHPFPRELTLPDAIDQLKINDATAAGRSRGTSTARNRSAGNGVGDDYYDKQHSSKHRYYSSDGSDRQRNSVYDNVSCEGFETARQDTDEEEMDDGRNKRRAVAREVAQPVSYSQACINGVTGGSSNRGAGHPSTTLSKEGGGGAPVVVRGGVFFSSLSNCSSSNSSSNNSSKYINASDSNIPAAGKAASNKSIGSNSKRLPPLSLLSNRLSSSTTKETNEHKAAKTNDHSSSATSALTGGNGSSKSKSEGQKSGGSSFAPWSCISCTFLNLSNPSVCEVCSRSRQAPGTAGIKPLVTGGRQCNQCTLINDKDAVTCSACNHTLEACPTYI